MDESAQQVTRAKAYQKIKQTLSLSHLAWTLCLLGLIAFTPAAFFLREAAEAAAGSPWLQMAVYFSLYSVIFLIFDLPYSYYSGFVIEHRYGLSNQSFKSWCGFLLKSSGLSFALSLVLLELLYAVIWNAGDSWWLIAWAGYAAVSLIIGKLFPVFIVPLFYKYDKVDNEELRRRIFSLAERYKMPVENIYSLNLSKTTKKANAAFMGMGKSKRVVLSDTLMENFTADEIETVVAHELGHFKHRDILKQLLFGTVSSFIGFWLVSRVMQGLTATLGMDGVRDLAAMPVIFFVFFVFSLVWTPLQSAFSRTMERAADRFALEAFPRPDVFISCMERLGRVNLADPSPHPLYEWYFYDHPAIYRRVAMAKEWEKRA